MSRAALLVASLGAMSCKESAPPSTYAPYGAPVPRETEIADSSMDATKETATEPDASAADLGPDDTADARVDANGSRIVPTGPDGGRVSHPMYGLPPPRR